MMFLSFVFVAPFSNEFLAPPTAVVTSSSASVSTVVVSQSTSPAAVQSVINGGSCSASQRQLADGLCYEHHSVAATWENARVTCQQNGGDLATPVADEVYEQMLLWLSEEGVDTRAHIGAHDPNSGMYDFD